MIRSLFTWPRSKVQERVLGVCGERRRRFETGFTTSLALYCRLCGTSIFTIDQSITVGIWRSWIRVRPPALSENSFNSCQVPSFLSISKSVVVSI